MFQNRLRKAGFQVHWPCGWKQLLRPPRGLRDLPYSGLLIHLTRSRCGFGEALSPFPVSLAHHHRLGVYYHVVLRLDV